MELLLSYIAILCPGLVTTIGVIILIITQIGKFTAFIKQFTDDKNAIIAQLAASDKESQTRIMELVEQNRELTKVNKILTDKIVHIQGYTDAKLKEEE